MSSPPPPSTTSPSSMMTAVPSRGGRLPTASEELPCPSSWPPSGTLTRRRRWWGLLPPTLPTHWGSLTPTFTSSPSSPPSSPPGWALIPPFASSPPPRWRSHGAPLRPHSLRPPPMPPSGPPHSHPSGPPPEAPLPLAPATAPPRVYPTACPLEQVPSPPLGTTISPPPGSAVPQKLPHPFSPSILVYRRRILFPLCPSASHLNHHHHYSNNLPLSPLCPSSHMCPMCVPHIPWQLRHARRVLIVRDSGLITARKVGYVQEGLSLSPW